MLPTLPTTKPAYPTLSDTKFQQLAAAYGTNAWMPDRIKVELDESMAKALKSLATHKTYIDQLTILAKQINTNAKAAADKAAKGKKPADLQAAVQFTSRAASLLNQIATMAHNDHQAFDGSWNEFRALNVKANAPQLPPQYQEDFTRAREKIMSDGKLINVKVVKLEQLVTQATAFNKMSATLATAASQEAPQDGTEAAQKAAKQLEDQLLDLMNKSMGSEKRNMAGGKNIGWVSVGSKINAMRTTAQSPKVAKQLYATCETYYVNIQAAVKTYKATVKTRDTLIATTLRTISPKTQKIQAVATGLANAKAIRKEAAGVQDEAIKTLAEADKLMAKMKKKVA